jgi:hypothetical protein
MDFFRASRSRLVLLLAAILLALAFSVWIILSGPPPQTVTSVNTEPKVDAVVEPVSASPSDSRKDSQGGAQKEPTAFTDKEEKARSARGAGFTLGKMLRDLYTSKTSTEGGKKHMDISEFAAASARTRRPVDMKDATAPSALRAELCSSIVAGSLDLPSVAQQKLAGILAESYAADSAAGALDESARKELRERLSSEAFARIRAAIPQANQSELDAFFSQNSFLFSLSVRADSISFASDAPAVMNSAPVNGSK